MSNPTFTIPPQVYAFLYALVGFLIVQISALNVTSGTTTALIVAVVIFVLKELSVILEPSPSPTTTPSPILPSNVKQVTTPDIQYQIGTNTITVTPNEPLGTKDANGYTVGQIMTTQVTSGEGTTVPVGAVYIGLNENGTGEWEYNGSYYD